MLRIHQSVDAAGTLLALEGKLLGPWVADVRIVAASALTQGAVRLDLTLLTYADAEGVAALHSLRRAGIVFVRSSAFIDDLLGLMDRSV